MAYKTSDGITVLEGLEAVRSRPALYIGADAAHPGYGASAAHQVTRALLLEFVVSDIAHERPQEFRILLWREGVVTIAYDGRPLPIEPSAGPVIEPSWRPAGHVPHPALYWRFTSLVPAMNGMAILNALSERLAVSTMHGGDCYRVVFSKGMIGSLLDHVHCDRPLGTTWLTFRPDTTILTGEVLTLGDAHGIAERVGRNTDGVLIRVMDRMTEDADWF